VGTDHYRPKEDGSGSDQDIIAESRVTLFIAGRSASERDTVVEHDVVPDLGGCTDDDAHPVVDEESPSDDGPRVNLDAGQKPHQLGVDARGQLESVNPQEVRPAVSPDGVQSRVGEPNLERVARSRIAKFGGRDIFTRSSE
jgi:hypothetical protein